MIGYSFGEYTAACAAGLFSLEEALNLVKTRGELIEHLPEGAMLSVPLPREELLTLLPADLSLAIDNGPSCIAAGSVEAIAAFEKQMKTRRYITVRLPAARAIHSHMMEPIMEKFKKAVEKVTSHEPRIPYISNLTAQPIDFRQVSSPGTGIRLHLPAG